MAYSNIDKPSKYFNTVLYTGNGSTQTITGLDFSPDLVWQKSRSDAYFNTLSDIVRGTGKEVYSNSTGAEVTGSNLLTAFNSDGFSVGNDAGWNSSGGTKVAWNWKANGAGVSNTAGSITSTVSANTTSGFSIVSYTGNGTGSPTVGHGLGVAPKMIIIKSRSSVANWGVGHASAGWNTAGVLNDTFSFGSSTYFASTNPTSSVFSIQDNTVTNISSATYIAYCFAEVKGFSKFGSYTGNGSTDGAFIYTGFKPAFFLNKRTDTTSSVWFMFDNKRNTFNIINKDLYSNLADAEATADRMDFLSNGFKCRSTSTSLNASGGTYIYAAFAENPFVSSKGIPTTAR